MPRGLDSTARVFTPARSVPERKRALCGLVATRVDERSGLDAKAADPVEGYRFATKRAGAQSPRARTAQAQAAGGRPSVRYESLWRSPKNRQTGPSCTAFGPLTAIHCRPTLWRPYPATKPLELYAANQAVDRAEGRVWDEGASVLAAMKNLQRMGFIGGYDWEYRADPILDSLARKEGVWVLGTEWFDFMFDREAADRKGRRMIANPGPGDARWSRSAGGHCYALNGLEDDWLRIPQTWGDGDYWLHVETFRVLLERLDGEATFMRETPPGFVPPPVRTFGIPTAD